MTFATRDVLLSRCQRRYFPFDHEGVTYWFRSLTGAEMRNLKGLLQKSDGSLDPLRFGRIPELLVCASLVDEDKNPIFRPEDAFTGVFDELDGELLNCLYIAAQRHTGFLNEENTQRIEDAVKNYKAAQSNGSPA